MQPEIHIGPLTLQTFGICFALAFIAAGAVIAKRFGELNKPPDWAYEIVFYALLGGVIGARLYYVVENYDEVSDDLLGNVFSGAGLVWYGGALGGALAVSLWAWWRGIFNVGLLDVCAAPLALGYAVGRIGCQLSGDGDYGQNWDGPWAMAYPDGTVPTDATVHPTPIYETLAMGTVALVLWRLRDRFRPGVLFALYLLFAGFERLLVEFIRRNDEVVMGLTTAQLLSIAMIAAGATWLGIAASRGRLERAAAGT
ncbi:MAG TPA: prolipoprotein diacylglyceryl transferase [Solirubrobacterales bacterium]|nr:prolipoprotein diacylglyceryl transferase [Solirubrobacterales bacterium]